MPETISHNPEKEKNVPTLDEYVKDRAPKLSRGTYQIGGAQDFLPMNHAEELASLEYKREILGEKLTNEEADHEHYLWLIKAGYDEKFASEYTNLSRKSLDGILSPEEQKRLLEIEKIMFTNQRPNKDISPFA